MSKGFILILVGAFFLISLRVQDGSNIRYYEPNKIDDTFIGKKCHIDYCNISFNGQTIDTIEIDVKGQAMKFYERRIDDGFNNWFNDQYLIKVADSSKLTVRLQDSRIDNVTKNKIFVTSILSYYKNKSSLDTITIFKHWYKREDIVKILIEN